MHKLVVSLFGTSTEARRVGVGVYLLNAVSLDTLNGLWTAGTFK